MVWYNGWGDDHKFDIEGRYYLYNMADTGYCEQTDMTVLDDGSNHDPYTYFRAAA